MHNRKLAHELSKWSQIGILTHCDEMNVDLPIGATKAKQQMLTDQKITTWRTGLQGIAQRFLHLLACQHKNIRTSRPFYAFMFRHLFFKQAYRFCKQYDLIHFVYNGLTESAELAADISQALNIPFVMTPLVCTDKDHVTAWATTRFRRLYRRADALVALTQHEREWLIAHGAPAERVHVCPYGPLLEPSNKEICFRTQHKLGNKPLVVFLGRVTREKGCDYLLNAATKIWQRHADACIAFIGPQDSYAKALFSSIQDDRLLFIERISQSMKASALKACTMLCVPSRAESLGVVYLEAWYYQKAVIALNLPALNEVIDHKHDGLLSAHHPESIADAICSLLDDADYCRKMGENGYYKLQQKYDWNIIVSKINSVYTIASQMHSQRHPVKTMSVNWAPFK